MVEPAMPDVFYCSYVDSCFLAKQVRTYAKFLAFWSHCRMGLGRGVLFSPGQYVVKCTDSIVIRIILHVKHPWFDYFSHTHESIMTSYYT